MTCAQKFELLTSLLFLASIHSVLASVHPDSCEADLHADAGVSLLQTSSKRTWPWPPPPESPEAHTARDILPAHMYKLGLELFNNNEETLNQVVRDTRWQKESLEGEEVVSRLAQHDGVDGVDGYGLNSLRQVAANSSGMVNMVDIGGNLGRVSITAFKKAPQKMRIVVVEPVPTTYFLLRWNLLLNKIPELTLSEFHSNPTKPGVLALDNAITPKDGDTVGLCGYVSQSMRARICDCNEEDAESDGKKCVVGRTMEHILKLFGKETIDFLKMDCEGCEFAALPSLDRHLERSGQKVARFVGELHEVTNDIEDIACKFAGHGHFWNVCYTKDHKYQAVALSQRCIEGPKRDSCHQSGGGVDIKKYEKKK